MSSMLPYVLSGKVLKKSRQHGIQPYQLRTVFEHGLRVEEPPRNPATPRVIVRDDGFRRLETQREMHRSPSILRVYNSIYIRQTTDDPPTIVDVYPFKGVTTNNPAELENVWKTVAQAFITIPRFAFDQLRMWTHQNAQRIILDNEIDAVVTDPECRYIHDRPDDNFTVADCVLRRESAYRIACDYLFSDGVGSTRERAIVQRDRRGRIILDDHGDPIQTTERVGPLGLVNEPWVLNQLNRNGFRCPTCGGGLVLGGGASTAWADLLCMHCPTFFEVKTRSRREPRRKGQTYVDDGGSHRWFHAQRQAGVRHFLIYIPKYGGPVHLYRIVACNFRIDSKFLAYFNHKAETGIEPSLRSSLLMERVEQLFIAHTSVPREAESAETADQALAAYFAHHAIPFQRAWRRSRVR